MTKLQTAVGICVLKRSERRTLAISVLPDGTIEVIAPTDASITTIREKVEARSRWVYRKRREFASMNACKPAPRYCTGATHRYLGRQYHLKVTKGAPQEVKLRGAYLCVVSRTESNQSVAALLSGWMRERAREQLERRVGKWSLWCELHKLSHPKISLLSMSKRWGSANKNGRIAFNPDLIKVPSVCIEYVIAHEMCHLLHPLHDKAFFAELDKLCPRWKLLKQRLESSEV